MVGKRFPRFRFPLGPFIIKFRSMCPLRYDGGLIVCGIPMYVHGSIPRIDRSVILCFPYPIEEKIVFDFMTEAELIVEVDASAWSLFEEEDDDDMKMNCK